MTRSDRTNASFVNQARRVALRGAKTARAEDQIRHLMFSVVTPGRHSCVESSCAQSGNGRLSGFAHRKTRGSRSVYFQSNVTDAFRRSEAELACSEISIVTTRTSVFRERRHPPIETAGALGVAGWVCDGRRSAPYLISRRVSAARSESRDSSGRPPSHDRAVAPPKVPPPAKSAKVFEICQTRDSPRQRSVRSSVP